MSETQIKIWDMLVKLDGETVTRLFTNYYGTQLLDEDFMNFLEQEEIY